MSAGAGPPDPQLDELVALVIEYDRSTAAFAKRASLERITDRLPERLDDWLAFPVGVLGTILALAHMLSSATRHALGNSCRFEPRYVRWASVDRFTAEVVWRRVTALLSTLGAFVGAEPPKRWSNPALRAAAVRSALVFLRGEPSDDALLTSAMDAFDALDEGMSIPADEMTEASIGGLAETVRRFEEAWTRWADANVPATPES